jgi:hypothetical protein
MSSPDWGRLRHDFQLDHQVHVVTFGINCRFGPAPAHCKIGLSRRDSLLPCNRRHAMPFFFWLPMIYLGALWSLWMEAYSGFKR